MSLEAAFEIGRLYLPLKNIADQFSLTHKDLFIRLPGLRGYWPMSAVNSTGAAIDHSNASVSLIRQGSPTYNFDGNAFVQLGVANDYLKEPTSIISITGTEAWIASGLRGMTVGGWFWVDSTPGIVSGLISKDAPDPERGFALSWDATNAPGMSMSGNGSTIVGVSYSVLPLNTWNFIVGRFTPSAELALLVNGNKVTNTTSIPASINVSTQDFEVGRFYNDNNRILEGRFRDDFICATALPDATIAELYRGSMPA